jgi:hypothetical protein
MIRKMGAILVIAVLAGCGCSSRPHAPALTNQAVYQNDEGGFRLEIPASWIVQSKTVVAPNERVAEERKLIGFRLARAERPAMFEISCMDMPEGANMVAHLKGPATGPNAWHVLGSAESLTLGSTAAQRVVLLSGAGATAVRKEVTAFQVGPRTFFFTFVGAPDDNETRDSVRRVIAGVSWKAG